MWLLDHNLPVQLRPLLIERGIICETAVYRKWDKLRNGELVAAVARAGFEVILTRDVKFSDAASKSLKKFSSICIVVARLPQRSGRLYVEAFGAAWKKNPIKPLAGRVIFWP